MAAMGRRAREKIDLAFRPKIHGDNECTFIDDGNEEEIQRQVEILH